MKSRTDKVLLVLLALAFFLRVVFFVQFHATPYYTHATLDAAIYDAAAKQFASGNLIQDRAFFMSPMYPFLLGGLYRLFGPGPASPRIFQMLLGLVACGLIYIYTGRIADRWTALITAGLYAFYAPILFYEQTLLMESSMAFGVILFMFVLYLSMGSRRSGWALCAGILLGILALYRANVLLFFPAACFFLLRWRKSGRSVLFTLLFTGGLLAAIAPAALHNYLAEKDFVLITSNAGFNLYAGNRMEASGIFEMPEGLIFSEDPSGRRIAERESGGELKSSEVSRYWMRKTLQDIRGNPFRIVRLAGVKTLYFWGRTEIAQIYGLRAMRSLIPALDWPFVGFSLVGPLSIIGIFLAIRDNKRELFPAAGFVFLYYLSLLPFFITARYRLPIMPLLCLFSAYAMVCLWEAIHRHRPRQAISLLIAWIFLFIVLDNESLLPFKYEKAHFHNTLGLLLQKEGRLEDAAREYRESIITDLNPGALANLASLHAGNNDRETAIRLYGEALELDAANPRLLFNLGQEALKSGQRDLALKSFEKAVRIDPLVHPLAWYNLAFLHAMRGEKQEAVEAMKAYLRMKPDDRDAPARLESLFTGMSEKANNHD